MNSSHRCMYSTQQGIVVHSAVCILAMAGMWSYTVQFPSSSITPLLGSLGIVDSEGDLMTVFVWSTVYVTGSNISSLLHCYSHTEIEP